MKKIIMLVLLVILLTGCSAEVNVIINDTGINETITITDNNTSSYYNNVPAFYKDVFSDIEPDVKNPGVEYYNRNITQGSDGYKINYSYKYNFDNYKNARTVKTAFKSFNLRKDVSEKQIIISTDSSQLSLFNTYSNLSSVRVNITPTYQVVKSNADYVNGNIYTWNFSKGTKKNIYIVMYNPNMTSGNSGGVTQQPTVDDTDEDNKNTTVDDKKNEDKEEVVDNKDDSNEKKETFLDKYPYVILLGAIVIFLMFVIIMMKISKSD